MSDGRGVIEAAFELLDEIKALEPARLMDLAEATGIPRPTVHRLLQQLVAVGAVRRDGTRYRIGASLLDFGGGWQVERRLRTVAWRPLAELASRTGVGVALSVQIGGPPVVLDFMDAREPLGFSVKPGSPVWPDTAQDRAHRTGLLTVDAGTLSSGITCVSVPILLPGNGMAVITSHAHGARPAPFQTQATRAVAATVAGIVH
ncbi:helix-turn-helix domain-containing protein [Kibdelosporangium philippinense]|uniref:Helix-turn-helix domain-containing protein n=1 Tax=Kibdelosporangium philippinense TaxID=211113 RepID=A0ABS8Z6C1_9PSEU|nr:helix-turn-helix domain-containing protein [Kibdelosporangium philippinense]MCE7003434.1 helix-turn-helix domain-containing protein [Kibdelosporangium philippinense]